MSHRSESDKPAGKNRLEWAVFAASSLLLATILILLGMDVARWEGRPARLEVTAGEPVFESGLLVVPISVCNRGDIAAINVTIQVSGGNEDGQRDATVTLDFVPRGAIREGRVAFPPDQDSRQIEARVSGYEVP